MKYINVGAFHTTSSRLTFTVSSRIKTVVKSLEYANDEDFADYTQLRLKI